MPRLLTEAQVRAYHDEGYLHLPDVIDGEGVAALRSCLGQAFERVADGPHAGSPDIIRDIWRQAGPELLDFTLHPIAVDAVRDLFGEGLVHLPVIEVQQNQFGPWHRDTDGVESRGHRFHLEPTFRYLNVGCYLQPNTALHGGGLDVEPGSHRPRPGPGGEPVPFGSRARVDDGVTIRSRAGDLVIFDFNLTHRASKGSEPPPARAPKLALFQCWASDQAHWADYRAYISGRPALAFLDGFQWPDSSVERAATVGVTLG